jgi:hypothetical protein
MASSNSKDLLSKLKISLPKIEPVADSVRTVHQFPDPAREPEPTHVAVPKGSRAPKLSVSLYQHDIERLDTIKDFMKSQGFRNLSDSEALRLACRKVEIDGTLIEVYRSMQGEDGRRR